MSYEHAYPLFLHRDDGQPGKVVENAGEAQEAFRQGFKIWTPGGVLVNPLETPGDSGEAEKPRKKKG